MHVRVMVRARPDVTPQLLTVREVATVMRVSNMTVYRLIKAGELVATRVGRSYRIFEDDVSAYLSRGTS
jgi:excisionase family DNA binding protein